VHPVSLAAGCVPEASPPETVTAAAGAGFDASGVWYDAATWSPAVAAEVRRRLDDTGLAALDLEVARLRPELDRDGLARLVDAAADVGAANILCISLDEDHARTSDHLAAVCAMAASAGITVVLEFMRFTAVHTLAEAVTVVRRTGAANAGVLVDALHLDRCGDGPADVAALEPALFPYLQLCDAVAVSPPADGLIAEALDGRLLPGEGALALGALLDAVGPETPVSVELRSAALRTGFHDPLDRARVIAAATRRLPGLSPPSRRPGH